MLGFLDCSVNETFLTFKNAHRMYKLNVKPAGNYIKFKCQAEGKYLEHSKH